MILHNIIYNEQLSYYRFRTKICFINPSNKELISLAKAIINKKEQHVHIFLTTPTLLNVLTFREFMEAWFSDMTDIPTVAIHVPKSMPDLAYVLTQGFLPSLWKDRLPYSVKVFCENKVVFKIRDSHPHFIIFRINDNDNLEVSYQLQTVPTFGYDKTFANGQRPSAVKNEVQAAFPELFRDKILTAFKENCPPGILKSFKTDEAIWEYITQNGEWKVEK